MVRKRLLLFNLIALLVNLTVLAVWMVGASRWPWLRGRVGLVFILAGGGLFLILGLLLVWLTYKEKARGWLKGWLLATGWSAVGCVLSAYLHNLVYGLMIFLLGEDFWERTGLGDEPVFFILAVLVGPSVFIVGIAGSLYLLVKYNKEKRFLK